jgi:hypothetical protein
MLGMLLIAISACASLRGSAEPVVSLQERLKETQTLKESTALRRFYASSDVPRGGLTQENYRNYVSDIYLSAADARYDAFKASLSREVRGTGFGSNATVLVLNGVAVVSGIEGARALAVAANVVSGANSALAAHMFNDKTLQALLAAMEGNRTTVKIRIRTGLQRPVSEYSLRDALDDIRDLEAQASLDSAIQQLTSLATNDTAAKKATLTTLYTAPVLKQPVLDELSKIADYIDNLTAAAIADPAKLKILNDMANAAHLTPGAAPQDTRDALLTWLDDPAQTADPAKVVATFRTATQKDTY